MATKKHKPDTPTPAPAPTKTVVLKEIEWLGHESKMAAFPDPIKKEGGFALFAVQIGDEPTNWAPMEIIGPGAKEIRLQDQHGWYRIFYVAKLSEAIFVLGVIEKKSNKTSQTDIDGATVKYRDAMAKNAAMKAEKSIKAPAQKSKGRKNKK